MSKRGTLYRCHLCSFLLGGGPQTEGIDAIWRQYFRPAGDRPRLSGERVELFVTINTSPVPIGLDTAIRLDLLEEDVVSDDLVGSICCGSSVQMDPDFKLLDYRKTRVLTLLEGETVDEAIAHFMAALPDTYQEHLLVLKDYALYETYYLVSWWNANHQQETTQAEFYFIVNIADVVEDTAQPVLNVKKQPLPPDQSFIDPALVQIALGSKLSLNAALADFEVDPKQADVLLDEDEGLPPGAARAADDEAFRKAIAIYAEKFPPPIFLAPGDQAAVEIDLTPETALAVSPASPAPRTSHPSPGPTGPDSEEIPGISDTWPWRAHPEGSLSDDVARPGSSPFDRRTLFLAQPDFLGIFDVRIATRYDSTHYVESYDLWRALRWGQTLFGPGQYAVFEGPLYPRHGSAGAARTHYTVVQLEEAFRLESVTVIKKGESQEIPGTIRISPYYQDRDGNLHVWRLFGNPRVISPQASAAFTLIDGVLDKELEWQMVTMGIFHELAGSEDDDAFQQRIGATVFKDVDKAIDDKKNAEAVKLLASLTYRALTGLDAAKRKQYALAVISEVGIFFQSDDANRTLLEIFKSFPAGEQGQTEIADFRKALGESDIDRIVRTVYEELTDILIEVGKRYPDSERQAIGAKYIVAIIMEGAGLNDPASIVKFILSVLTVGMSNVPTSLGDLADLARDVAQALRSLIDFLKDFVWGLLQIVIHPVDFVTSIGSLIALVMRALLAAVPLPETLSVVGLAVYIAKVFALPREMNIGPFRTIVPTEEIEKLIRENAPEGFVKWLDMSGPKIQPFWNFLIEEQKESIKEIDAVVKLVKDSFENAIVGVRKFDVEKQLMRRYKFRLIWEIASFFVGAGEVKAALQGVKGSARAAALLAAKLGGKGEAISAIEKAAQIVDHTAELGKAAHAVEGAAHLPAGDLGKTAEVARDAKRLGEAKTFDQLANHNAAEVVEALKDASTEVKAGEILRKKVGGTMTEVADAALARMRTEGALTEQQLLSLMERLPESNADTFSRAIGHLPKAEALGLAPDAMGSLYTHLARNPRLAELLARGNDVPGLFAGIMKAKGQNFAEVERLLLHFEEEAGRLKQPALAKLAEDVAAGRLTALEDSLKQADGAKAIAAKLNAMKAPVRAEAEKALSFLRTRGAFTDAELARFLEGVSDERVQKFLQAVNNLPPLESLSWLDQPDMASRFFKQLARAPRSIDRLAEGGDSVRLFQKLFNSSGGGMADTERLFAALDREAARLAQAGKPADAARLAADALEGKTDDLERIAESMTPKRPRLTEAEIQKRWQDAKELPPWQKVLERRAAEAARPKPTTAQWHMRDVLRNGEDLYLSMSAEVRAAVERIASRDENLFRDMITELDQGRYQSLRAALAKDLNKTKSLKPLAEDALKGIDSIRDARVQAVREAIGDFARDSSGALVRQGGQLVPAAASDVAASIVQKLTMNTFDNALTSKVKSMERRLADFEKVLAEAVTAEEKTAAQAPVNKLKNEIKKLRDWGGDANRAAELRQLQEAVQANLPLRDLLHHGGGPLLMESAIEMAFGETLRSAADVAKSPLKTIPGSFAEYLATRMSHFRGNFGEWELAFDLGKQGHVILKCGDEFVSRTGTDLISMVRQDGRWRMLIFDNKALRDATVNEVSALVDNLLKNIKSDQLKFAAIAKRADAPLEFAEAAKRLEAVSADIEKILKKYNGKMTKAAQAEIARALALQDIQLVVSNPGGQVKGISGPLKTMMDFYDAKGGQLPPARPIPTAPAVAPTP